MSMLQKMKNMMKKMMKKMKVEIFVVWAALIGGIVAKGGPA